MTRPAMLPPLLRGRAQRTLPPVWLTLAVASALIALGWRAESIDMVAYIGPWFRHIVAAGPIGAFAHPFSNYTPPYLYLLAVTTVADGLLTVTALAKLLGLAGAALLALAVRRLLVALGHDHPSRGAALGFALPSVVINAGVLGQCDPWWAAATIMALTAAIHRRHVAMLVWFGLAIAFKAQAGFAAPFFVGLLIQRRVPTRLWIAAPLAAAAAMLPAALAGWPIADLATIYLRQADTFSFLSYNAPNIWMIVQPLSGGLQLTGLALAAGVGAAAAYVAWLSARRLDGADLVAAAMLAPMLVAGLLPRMHERYFFLADVLALAFALVAQDRRASLIFALVQIGSLLALFAFMLRIDALAIVGGASMIAATGLTVRRLLVSPANDNGLPLNPARIYSA